MRLIPAPSIAAAYWLHERIHSFAESVVSIVPAGFPAYGRIYHPARLTIARQASLARWADVAAMMGRVAHRQMQWPHIAGNYRSHGARDRAPLFVASIEAPAEGSLPPEVARPLWQALATHTTTPEHCWFAVWEGWGCLDAKARSGATFGLPNRRFHLFYGAIDAIETSFCDSPSIQSANLWWPADHAWCVATEIDFMTTYVAGSDAAIAALASCTALETDKVDPADGVAWASDTINARDG